ncbi:ParB N-terminal domain-containing protein [Amycolatopsis cynarae]|uniref:ParB N-terminal domain-containing protein n=1 Tax=Amycolatopsis cynarae TaxID=2995223 RepID=A0ABY7B8S1_9PSEU|nr:ParB N-terminal domain-containing protein [Amycolatopsis sp. HUAS 11-8]WAL67133.1 ParB N-terminal domain-containing protein [Amycolatopsis sp. HUAS 11-8]
MASNGGLSAVARGIGSSAAAPRGGSYGQLSPLAMQYQEWQFGRPYDTALPRDPSKFLSGAFGPLEPIVPVGIDEAAADGRPMPRRQQYNVGWNMPSGPPGSEGLKIATFATLRSFADLYSVVRATIQLCIGDIIGTDWDIVPTKSAELAMHGDDAKQEDFAKRREEALRFWARPDPNYRDFQTWFKALLEDHYVLDAMSVYMHPTRMKGHGPFGSSLASLDIIDGSTIRPLLDIRGGSPAAPNAAYQQYLWGVPRVDLSLPMLGDEEDVTTTMVDEFRGDQLLYLPFTTRSWTPYGFSNLERALIPVATGLRRQIYAMQFYSEGSIPAVYVTPGPEISTPQQIAQLQRALNNIAGDQAYKHKIIVLPPGSKTDPQKVINLADQFDQVLAAEVTMAFEKTPMDIGITPRISAVQSPSETKEFSQINSENAQKRGVKPRLEYLKAALFDYVMQKVWGQTDMEWHWTGMETPEDQQVKVDVWTALVKAGIASIDQAAQEFGLDPWKLPQTSVPMVQTASGPVPLTSNVPVGSPDAQGVVQEASARGEDAPDDAVTGHGTHAAAHAAETRYRGKPTPAHAAASAVTAGSTSAPPPAPRKPASAATSTKAAHAELDALVRHLRKGREVSDWAPKALTPDVLAAVAAEPDLEKALHAGRAVIRAAAYIERRTGALAEAMRTVAAKLGQIVYRYRTGVISLPEAIDLAVATIRQGYRDALRAGGAHAALDHPATTALDFDDEADEDAEQQRGYVTNLLMDVHSETASTAELGRRLELYGDTLTRAYSRGYGAAVVQSHPQVEIVWHLGDTEHCALCRARDGKVYTPETLPGFPGEGGFGGPICEGGPRCGCWLEYREATRREVVTNPQREHSLVHHTEQNRRMRQMRAQADQAREQWLAALPPAAQMRARSREALKRELARLANERIRQSGGYQGVTVSPNDIPAKVIADILGPGTQRRIEDVRPAEIQAAAERLFKLARSAQADVVHDYLAEVYPADTLQWVKQAEWRKAEVPLADIDMDRRPGGRDPKKVRGIAQAIKDGKPMDPVVLVDTGDEHGLQVADGYHRTLAFRHAGRKTITAYVASGVGEHGPWEREMHDRKLNKSEKTPMYSVTHNPLGVHGLWHHAGLQLPAYIQNVAHGLMESGHERQEAIQMAIGVVRNWAEGKGHVHPEVRAASAKAIAEWERLKATHNKSKR